jgi:hypothetical protein
LNCDPRLYGVDPALGLGWFTVLVIRAIEYVDQRHAPGFRILHPMQRHGIPHLSFPLGLPGRC